MLRPSNRFILLLLWSIWNVGHTFVIPAAKQHPSTARFIVTTKRSAHHHHDDDDNNNSNNNHHHSCGCSTHKHEKDCHKSSSKSFSFLWKNLGKRLNTIESAGLKADQVQTAGLLDPIKKAHDPKTYIVLALLAGLKWNWCFRNPYYWFAVGFCIKWYRARYVFKIPVWDRQPNWNNIITSKEQEKDLKAYTCKNCGSTLFIAKTREFFFEGNTGIGGLGCFACGAKGKDNFIMDRDRIVEDVADIDDYFEYERPLDFVSAAERRKLLKETAGDEEKANQILLDRAAAAAGGATATATTAPETKDQSLNVVDAEIVPEPTVDAEEETESSSIPAPPNGSDKDAEEIKSVANEEVVEPKKKKEKTNAVDESENVTPKVVVNQDIPAEKASSKTEKTKEETKEDKPKKKKKKAVPVEDKSPAPTTSSSAKVAKKAPVDDDLSILDMDL